MIKKKRKKIKMPHDYVGGMPHNYVGGMQRTRKRKTKGVNHALDPVMLTKEVIAVSVPDISSNYRLIPKSAVITKPPHRAVDRSTRAIDHEPAEPS